MCVCVIAHADERRRAARAPPGPYLHCEFGTLYHGSAHDCRRPRRHLSVKPVHTAHGAHQIQCLDASLRVVGSLFTARSLIFTPTRKRSSHMDPGPHGKPNAALAASLRPSESVAWLHWSMCSSEWSWMSAQRSMCTAFSVHDIDRLRGICESVGRDRIYRPSHACKEAQACAASSSTRTVYGPLNILKR